MTKTIIVDYSLEIVIVIIIYDPHNLHWLMFIHCLKQSDDLFLDEKTNWKPLVLSLKCELYCILDWFL